MPISVTLDPDVEALVKQVMRERRVSLNDALNFSLRAALKHPGTQAHFQQQTFALGSTQHFRCDKALEGADAIEDHELASKVMSCATSHV